MATITLEFESGIAFEVRYEFEAQVSNTMWFEFESAQGWTISTEFESPLGYSDRITYEQSSSYVILGYLPVSVEFEGKYAGEVSLDFEAAAGIVTLVSSEFQGDYAFMSEVSYEFESKLSVQTNNVIGLEISSLYSISTERVTTLVTEDPYITLN